MRALNLRTDETHRGGGLNWRDWAGLCVGVPLLLSWMCFAELKGYPTNDDPFYGRPAQILADESRFQLVRQAGELSASSVMHILIGGGLAWLTGFSYRSLFLAVIWQLWLAAAMLYLMAREGGCNRWFAFFWASVFLANPLSVAHAFTFMTDAPAMSWGMIAVYGFRRGLVKTIASGRTGKWLWIGSVAVGIAFWMRQTHVLLCAFPVGGLCWLWYRQQLTPRQVAWAVLASLVPATVAVLLFESGWLVFGDNVVGDEGRLHTILPTGVDWYQTAINVYGAGILIGFLLLPVWPVLIAQGWASPWGLAELPKWSGKVATGMALSIGALWIFPLVATRGAACLTSATGSVLSNAHFGPIFLSDFENSERWGDMGGVAWPGWIWAGLTALAILNLATGFGRLIPTVISWFQVKQTRVPRAALTFGLFSAAVPIILVVLSVRTGVQDRYWMLLLPIVFASVPEMVGARQRNGLGRDAVSRVVQGSACALLLLQFGFSMVMARDFLVWNRLRWEQVETWLETGLLPEEIDGGRDINAWYRSAEDYETMPREGDNSTWWSGRAHRALSIGPREGWEEVGQLHWRAWATGREHAIMLLRQESSVP
jgi:hypothetical protein